MSFLDLLYLAVLVSLDRHPGTGSTERLSQEEAVVWQGGARVERYKGREVPRQGSVIDPREKKKKKKKTPLIFVTQQEGGIV